MMKVLLLAPPLRRWAPDEGRPSTDSGWPLDSFGRPRAESRGRSLAALTAQVLRSTREHRVVVSDSEKVPAEPFNVVQVCVGDDLAHASRQVMEVVQAGMPVVLAVPRVGRSVAQHEAAMIWSLAACADEAAFASQGDRLTLSALADTRIAGMVTEPLAGTSIPRPSGSDSARARDLGRFVILDPPSPQAAQAASRLGVTAAALCAGPESAGMANVQCIGPLSPQETADAYQRAAAFVAGSAPESLRRAVDAALCECPVACPDTALAREVLGDGAHLYARLSEKGLEQALAEALQAPRAHVTRARILATGADRHPLLRLPEVYARAIALHQDRERRSLRLSRALALHALAWKDAACYWAARYEQAASQAADLHRRLTRLASLPLVRQALALKRLLGK